MSTDIYIHGTRIVTFMTNAAVRKRVLELQGKKKNVRATLEKYKFPFGDKERDIKGIAAATALGTGVITTFFLEGRGIGLKGFSDAQDPLDTLARLSMLYKKCGSHTVKLAKTLTALHNRGYKLPRLSFFGPRGLTHKAMAEIIIESKKHDSTAVRN